MIRHVEQKILPYSQEQLFALVADIERYPEFLPWCQQTVIHQRDSNKLMAELTIGYKLFQESYISHVTLTPPTTVNVQYAKGPLKHLRNHWNFQALTQNSCQVHFEVEFELKSFLLQKAVEAAFNSIIAQMLKAFEKRANVLYS